jgi:hypothetical protein
MKTFLRLWRTRNDPLWVVGIYMYPPAQWELSGIYTSYELAFASIKYLPPKVNLAHVFLAPIAKDAAPLRVGYPLQGVHYPFGGW